MKILAIDTATERCSVAILDDDDITERSTDTARGHADLVLPMVESLLRERQLTLATLDGIAYGRGPGAFTGVRITIGVVQGLAFGAHLVTTGVSNLAAVAQQVARPADRVLVCMDARMGEVYWGIFECAADSGLVRAIAAEQVSAPDQVLAQLDAGQPIGQSINALAGTGLQAYPQLAAHFPDAARFPSTLPRAREIALLGVHELQQGRGQPAIHAQPVYLRNQVAVARRT